MDARSKHSVAFHYATSSSSSVPRSMDRVVPGICIKRPVVFLFFLRVIATLFSTNLGLSLAVIKLYVKYMLKMWEILITSHHMYWACVHLVAALLTAAD